jgi:hypothetical protein
MAGPWEEYAQPAQAKPWEQYGGTTPQAPVEMPLETAKPPQPGQAPYAEQMFGQLGAPTGNLLFDTIREYPYQLEGGVRSGLEMAGHGGRLAGLQGDPSGIIGMLAGGASAASAPIGALFGPISRPVHDLIGNPVERATGIPADVTTAGAMALPGAFKLPGGPRVREPAPPRTQVRNLAGAPEAMTQRTEVLSRIEQAKNEAYRRSEEAGVIIKPDTLRAAADEIRAELADEGFHPMDQPAIERFLTRLTDDVDGGQNVTLKHLDTLRKQLVGITKDFNNPNQARLAGHAIERIDSMPLADGDVIVPRGVDPQQALSDLRQGRALAKTQAKAAKIDQALTKAMDRAATGGSGANIENAVRQNLRALLDRITTKKDRSFSPAEVAELRRVVHGGNLQNVLRLVGKYSPEHPLYSMLAAIGAGGVVGGPAGAGVGAAIAGAGAVSKFGAEAMNRYGANRLFNTVARGGPRPPDRSVPPNFEPPAPSGSGSGGRQPPPMGPGPQSQIGATMYSNPFGERIASGIERALGFQQPFQPKPLPGIQMQAPLPRQPGQPAPIDSGRLPPIRSLEDAQAFNRSLGQTPPPAPRPALQPPSVPQQIRQSRLMGRRRTEEIDTRPDPEDMAVQRLDRAQEGVTTKPTGEITLADNDPNFASWSRRPDGTNRQHHYAINQGGQEIGYIIGRVKGDEFYVDHVMTVGGPNTLTPRVMRDLGRALRSKLPPDIQTIGGKRVSGARHGPARSKSPFNARGNLARIPSQALSVPIAATAAAALLEGFDQEPHR